MKKLAAVLPLLLAACAGAKAAGEPARLTIYGDEPRLEIWNAVLVEGAHIHSEAPEAACPLEALGSAMQGLFARPETPPRVREAAAELPDIVESLCVLSLGRAHGGPRRLALLLVSPGGDEALAVDVPRLAPGESERSFRLPSIAVEFESPPGIRRASIERGSVTLRRLGPGRYDVEIFAVLRPADLSRSPLQLIARVEAGPGDR